MHRFYTKFKVNLTLGNAEIAGNAGNRKASRTRLRPARIATRSVAGVVNRGPTGDRSSPSKAGSRFIVTFHDSPDPKIGLGDPGDTDASCDPDVFTNPNH
jgi:hypothetical protein